MLDVSATYLAAEIADIAQLAKAVYIYRGNYASSAAFGASASSSGDDASGDYPAAGAIDGDCTELNIGPASGADNGVGLSSWKSASTPSGASPVWLEVDFGATRTFNYAKLYNLAADPLTDYALQYWDTGTSAWVTFAGTSSRSATPGYTGGLDVYDLAAAASDVGAAGSTITTTKVRVLVYGTTNSDAAQIVELEIYYKVDVTDRCTSIRVDRQRDWRQVNPMAASVSLQFDNSDRFFSPAYTPTAAETAAGFFNQELDAGLRIQVQLGFYYSGAPYYEIGFGEGGFGAGPFGGATIGPQANPEIVNSFIGTIDEIKTRSKTGVCTITGRDRMKDVINETWSTRLKYGIDIGDAIKYCLNICNISDYEMSIDTTGLVVPNFFSFEQTMFSVIQQLVQAAGLAQFWFDENGNAKFQNLLATSDNSHTTLTLANPAFSGFYTIGTSSWVNNTGGSLVFTNLGIAAYATTNTTCWKFNADMQPPSPLSYWGASIYLMASSDGSGGSVNGDYYLYFRYDYGASTYSISFYYNNGSVWTPITVTKDFSGSHTYTIYRAPSTAGGVEWLIYMDNTLLISYHETSPTSTTGTYFVVANDDGTMTFSDYGELSAELSLTSYDDTTKTLYFTSASIDQGASISAESLLSVSMIAGNAPITWETRTSSDGATWGSWTAVSIDSIAQSGPIASTAARYIEYRYYFVVGSSVPLWVNYYVTVSWSLSAAAGTVRALSYDSSLCDVQEQVSDSLGGPTSVVNYFEVTASPVILTGTNADVQWQGSTGYPGNVVSASNPLVLYTGTTYIQAVVSGGMDISRMTGTNPAAVQITWGTAAGSVEVSYVHPTKPIIKLTVTTAGTITQLNLIGQSYGSGPAPISVTAGDSSSQSKYRRRTNQINNNFITSPAIAQLIANNQLLAYKTPAKILSGVLLPLTPSLQQTDQLQLTELNLGLTSALTWKTSGITHQLAMSAGGQATATTTLKAVAA